MKNHKGFTLVEIIIYIALSSFLLLAMTSFFQTSLSARTKSETIAELEQQAMQIMNRLVYVIENAEAINSPSIGNSASSLSLAMSNASINPTVFSLSNKNISMTEGVSAPLNLNNDLLEVDNLKFTNLSYAATAGIIRIEFTLSYVNNDNSQEHSWSKTFYNSVALP